VAVSKRLRFEILRRDNHACRYCGRSAPEVKLTVDHVIPEALGGATAPENLVAACADCNSGKSSASPDAAVVADVKSDALRWARAMAVAAEQMEADQAELDAEADLFAEHWNSHARFGRVPPVEAGWRGSIATFRHAGLPLTVLYGCVDKALAKKLPGLDTYKYMCGIAWSMIRELQEAAALSLAEPPRHDEPSQEDLYEMVENLVSWWPSEEMRRTAHRYAKQDLSARSEGWTGRDLILRTGHWLISIEMNNAEVGV
jgi:hypothetical protein